jgi:Zn-finger nucleic acid-binding protein
MPCPVDGTALVMSERSGIEIDYCPTCRGVWLDRGELDKIIERNAEPAPQAPTVQAAPAPRPAYEPQQQGYDPRYHGQRKRKKSFLEELFD